MTSTDSSETSEADVAKEHKQTSAELYISDIPASNKPIRPDSRPTSSGRHLDVDAVLERSVRKVVTE